MAGDSKCRKVVRLVDGDPVYADPLCNGEEVGGGEEAGLEAPLPQHRLAERAGGALEKKPGS